MYGHSCKKKYCECFDNSGISISCSSYFIGTPLKYLKTLDRNCDLKNENGTGVGMRPASVSGMVTGDAPILPIFAFP